jgi:type IV pilus assembly protein PilC
MAVFEYEIVDKGGGLGRGRVDAVTAEEVIQHLREQGRFVVSVRLATGPVSDGPWSPLRGALARSVRRIGRGVKLGTLVLFTGQLAAMLDAGIHLVRILTALAGESTNKHFATVINDIKESVTGGASLADAMKQHPQMFSKLYVAVVRAGELSGSLPIVLGTLTTYLEKADHLRRKIKGAIAYPAVILTIAVLIVVVMIVKIVPIFEAVYEHANATLPAPTRLLVAISRAFREYTLTTLVSGLTLCALTWAAVQTDRGRRLLDQFKLRIPLFGPLIRKAIMARICRTMGLLLQSGISLIEALQTIEQIADNRVIAEAVRSATLRVREGGTVAETFRATRQFPPMVTQLIASGEESGTLPAMLGKAAVYYEQQVDNTVATLSTLIEPIMIVVVGAIAGGIVFALYLPIFNLGQAVRGGLK